MRIKKIRATKHYTIFSRRCPFAKELGNDRAVGNVTVNLGELYLYANKLDSSLYYFNKSLKIVRGTQNEAYTLMDIGNVYAKQGNYQEAISNFKRAIDLCKKFENKLDMSSSLITLGNTYYQMGLIKAAMASYKEAQDLAIETGANPQLKDAYLGMALSFAKTGDFTKAYKYQSLFSDIKDTLYKVGTADKVRGYNSILIYRKSKP
jgi:tetratricopeptide (TPR) repeat protein